MIGEIAINTDPDQTTVLSKSALLAYAILLASLVFEILEHLP